MNAENVVVNNAFNDVERAEPDKHRANEKPASPEKMAAVRGAPEDKQSGDDEEIRGAMEDAVPPRIQFEILNCVHRIPAAQHVVPLKQLVENNPVEKPAEAEAETGK
jgi:hypothetical protein